jgi:hypothetical protein
LLHAQTSPSAGGASGDRWNEFLVYETERQRKLEEDKQNREQVHALLEKLSQQPVSVDQSSDHWTSRILGMTILPPRLTGIVPSRQGEDEYLVYSLMTSLTSVTGLRLVDRSLLDQVLLELNLTQEGLADPKNAVRIGDILSARLVVTGTLFYLPDKLRAVLQVVDCETTEIVSVIRVESDQGVDGAIEPLTRSLVSNIRRAYPVKGKVVSVDDAQGIQLNVGSQQGVREGMLLEVLSAVELQDHVVGKIEVIQVDAVTSRAVVKEAAGEMHLELRVREAPQG